MTTAERRDTVRAPNVPASRAASPHARTAYLARWVLPISSPPVEHGAVIVEGARIVAVGPAATLADQIANARAVQLGHAVLMPGLVNAHTHLELTAMRGFLEGLDFREWLRVLTQARRDCMDADAALDACRFGVLEGLRYGVTTFADTTESGQPILAMRDLGVRGVGYVEVFGPDPAQRPEAMAGLQRAVNALRRDDTALVRTGVSPHAPYTVSAPLFRDVAQWARHEQLPIAVHIAESVADTAFVREGTGPFADRLRARNIPVAPQARSPIALLHDTGVLAAQPLLIHAIQADDEDLARVADHGATIVHCPISNAKLGHGIAPLDRMLAVGIPTGLGSDSVASNDRMDLLTEARQATLFHALRAGAPDSLSAHDALRLATLGGARALGLDARIGSLEVGKDADLAAFSLDHPFAEPVFDPAVTLVHVLAGTATASLVTVAGRELVVDGVPTHDHVGLSARMAGLGERLRRWRADNLSAR